MLKRLKSAGEPADLASGLCQGRRCSSCRLWHVQLAGGLSLHRVACRWHLAAVSPECPETLAVQAVAGDSVRGRAGTAPLQRPYHRCSAGFDMLLRDSSHSGGVVLQRILDVPAIEVMPLALGVQPWAARRNKAAWPIYNPSLVYPKLPKVGRSQSGSTVLLQQYILDALPLHSSARAGRSAWCSSHFLGESAV